MHHQCLSCFLQNSPLVPSILEESDENGRRAFSVSLNTSHVTFPHLQQGRDPSGLTVLSVCASLRCVCKTEVYHPLPRG